MKKYKNKSKIIAFSFLIVIIIFAFVFIDILIKTENSDMKNQIIRDLAILLAASIIINVLIIIKKNIIMKDGLSGKKSYYVEGNSIELDPKQPSKYSITVKAVDETNLFIDGIKSKEMNFEVHTVKLDSPKLKVVKNRNKTILKWDYIVEAAAYVITVNGEFEKIIGENHYELPSSTGNYRVEIVAIGSPYRTTQSDPAVYNCFNGGKLDSPELVRENNTISWEPVNGATGYIVDVKIDPIKENQEQEKYIEETEPVVEEPVVEETVVEETVVEEAAVEETVVEEAVVEEAVVEETVVEEAVVEEAVVEEPVVEETVVEETVVEEPIVEETVVEEAVVEETVVEETVVEETVVEEKVVEETVVEETVVEEPVVEEAVVEEAVVEETVAEEAVVEETVVEEAIVEEAVVEEAIVEEPVVEETVVEEAVVEEAVVEEAVVEETVAEEAVVEETVVEEAIVEETVVEEAVVEETGVEETVVEEAVVEEKKDTKTLLQLRRQAILEKMLASRNLTIAKEDKEDKDDEDDEEDDDEYIDNEEDDEDDEIENNKKLVNTQVSDDDDEDDEEDDEEEEEEEDDEDDDEDDGSENDEITEIPESNTLTENNFEMKEPKITVGKPYSYKFKMADDSLQEKYSRIKNALLKYKKVKCRVSKTGETFRRGREVIAKLNIVGKTLRVYLALDPLEYEQSKYHFRNVGNKKKYENVPMLMRVKSELSCKKTIVLIEDIGVNKELQVNKKYFEKNYAEDFVLDSQEVLIKNNLVDLLKSEIAFNNATTFDSDILEKLVPTANKEPVVIGEKIEEKIYIDDIASNFDDNDTVDINTLKLKGLISKDTNYITVVSQGVLNKVLTVYANEFTDAAVKMIVVVGGRTFKVKTTIEN